jgi:hypothetical protein
VVKFSLTRIFLNPATSPRAGHPDFWLGRPPTDAQGRYCFRNIRLGAP